MGFWLATIVVAGCTEAAPPDPIIAFTLELDPASTDERGVCRIECESHRDCPAHGLVGWRCDDRGWCSPP
ncbi:MAG: hypothetical protein AB7S26_19505 [Sandaracinaceae bacterium]